MIAWGWESVKDSNLNTAYTRAFDFNPTRALNHDFDLDLGSELVDKLKQLREDLPKESIETREFQQWWQANGTQWIKRLRQVMSAHRNIGYNWQFTEAQKRQLQSYYDANKFVVDLTNIKGGISDSVRANIEN
nr:hypothetical protein [Nostoc sp. EkiNYC01]